ncbi:helix-turn-helix transcriptional regulator [Saccharothrix australiensis]|uniref:DNA-binding CsgD family transcriptional regulator n=1 Tax=Saccharothrix australiensis TaxID=2072 RepID=A0A495W3Z0_9PSEU|nr:LuxR C-terminal-related transcriptional regulator [Saccharothrix australiensis]RKT56386.1 DNA-binding CsgD family transcriptional regulator [Saccharothrix australiensis]
MSKLYGRDREWASVLRFLSTPGGLLAIDGPPCSGKTHLLHEAVGAARDLGYAVVLVPGEQVATSADVADALRRAEREPGARTLVAVDHAHRDPCALLDLLPRLREHRVTGLVALSGAHAGAEVRRALPRRGDVLVLGPVGDDVVRRVVEDLLGATPRPDLAALVASAAGDPRLVGELVTGLREEGRLDVLGGTARLRGGRLPRRVTGLVGGRVDLLSAKAARLLRVTAVLGRSFPLTDVATMVGETAAALLPAVDEMIASGLVVRAGERLAFASELVWRAVVESIPDPVAHALRRDAAVLRAASRDLPPPAAAGRSGEDRGAAALPGVRALAASGRLGSAVALARAGLALRPHGPDAAEMHLALAGVLLADGRPAEAVAELDHALAVPELPDGPRRTAAAGRLLALLLSTVREAGAHAMSVLTARDREVSDADVVMAGTVHSCLEWSAGRLAESMYWAREAARWELDGPTAWWQSHTAVAFALKLSALGEFDQAERLVRGDGPLADDTVPAGAPAARVIALSHVLARAGRLAEAEEAARAGLSLARDRGLRLLVPSASSVLAEVALHRGDVSAAARHARPCRGDLAGGGVPHAGRHDWVELLLAHASGGPGRAAELARDRLCDPDRARRVLVEEPGAAAWLVRLALTVGDSRLAGAAVGAAEELARGNPGFAAVSAAASHARALVDRDEEALRAVVGRHRHPWAEANAHEDLALLLARRGRAERAAGHREQAARMFARMGADGEVARLRDRAVTTRAGTTPAPTPADATPAPTPVDAIPVPTPGGATSASTPGGIPVATPGGIPEPTPAGDIPAPGPAGAIPAPTPAVDDAVVAGAAPGRPDGDRTAADQVPTGNPAPDGRHGDAAPDDEAVAAPDGRAASPVTAAATDWQRLTGPERDIARLVGVGLTNRQVAKQLFLSPHTVDYHLRCIFKKLGISSRVELARLAHEQAHAEVRALR